MAESTPQGEPTAFIPLQPHEIELLRMKEARGELTIEECAALVKTIRANLGNKSAALAATPRGKASRVTTPKAKEDANGNVDFF